MIDQIFSVYDSKAEAYLPPFMLPKVAMAQRTFGDTVNSSDSQMYLHPQDYTLFHLGEFDNTKAQYDLFAAPKSLGNGVEYLSLDERDETTNDTQSHDPQLSGHPES